MYWNFNCELNLHENNNKWVCLAEFIGHLHSGSLMLKVIFIKLFKKVSAVLLMGFPVDSKSVYNTFNQNLIEENQDSQV